MKITSELRKKYKVYKKDWIKHNTTATERGEVELLYEDAIRAMCVDTGFDFTLQSKIYTLEQFLRENDGYNGKMYMSLDEFVCCVYRTTDIMINNLEIK